jgi:phosphoesterase RecJ-like protein
MNDISNFFQLKTIFMSQQSYKIIVTTHKNPDGDALGSSIAVSRFLRKLGHQVSLVIPDAILRFISGCQI